MTKKYYFTTDGTYGSANNMVIIDTSNFTPEEWEWIEQSTDTDRQRMASLVGIRVWYRKNHRHDDVNLPCKFCHFVEDETTECGYVWITCDADDDNGCDWGNS